MTRKLLSVLLCAVIVFTALVSLSVSSFAEGEKKTAEKTEDTEKTEKKESEKTEKDEKSEKETEPEKDEKKEEKSDKTEAVEKAGDPEEEIAADGAEDTSGKETDQTPVAEPVAEEKNEEKEVKLTSVKYDDEAGKLTVTFRNDGDMIAQFNVFLEGYDTNQVFFSQDYASYIQMQGAVHIASAYNIEKGESFDMQFAARFTDPAATPLISLSAEYLNKVITRDDGTKTAVYENIYAESAAFSESQKKAEVKTEEGSKVTKLMEQTGFYSLIAKFKDNWKTLVMIAIACVLLYLAIGMGFEPLLLIPIAFGMLLTNLPGAEMFHEALFAGGHVHWDMFASNADFAPGLIDYLYLGVKLGIYPCLIFVGVGAMTDFAPLIANPKSLLLGAAAQLGIFLAFGGAIALGFTSAEAGSIGIIGGADGPTAIYVTSKLAPALLGPIAVAAYSYMALVPVIQPPIMKLLTTKEERRIKMTTLRPVSKKEKIIFPIAVTVFVAFLIPSAAPLVGSLMLGNLLKECGVADRLSKTAQNEMMNIVTIFLGISVGATATAETFLSLKTLGILAMGVCAFAFGTAGGVLLAKFMNLFLPKGKKINPLIGSAGVSAVPMAARVSQVVGQKEDPSNFLLMHAMGPNVAGVIGSAIAAGALIALFG